MKKLVIGVLTALICVAAMATHHESVEADVRAAVEAFDKAYATNDVETYFAYYADGATIFYSGERQDLTAYREEWTALIEAGDGVEINEMSDLIIQIMPSGDTAISTSFVDNSSRYGDEVVSIRAFETDVWQKIDGEWKVVSLHYTELDAE